MTAETRKRDGLEASCVMNITDMINMNDMIRIPHMIIITNLIDE